METRAHCAPGRKRVSNEAPSRTRTSRSRRRRGGWINGLQPRAVRRRVSPHPHVRAYPLKPGMAKVYNEGDVHSPKREGSTRLIRIEGTNMDKVKRLTYEKV